MSCVVLMNERIGELNYVPLLPSWPLQAESGFVPIRPTLAAI